MASKLTYTSAPRLLQAGRSGFGTAAMHRNIAPPVIQLAEARSQFSRSSGFPIGRVIYSYRVARSASGFWHVLSCVRDAGTDYSGRTNHLAQHLILSDLEAEQFATRGETPAHVMLAYAWPDFDGKVGWMEDELHLAAAPVGTAGQWWARYAPHGADCRFNLAQGGAVFEYSGALAAQNSDTAGEILWLFAESAAECARSGWGITFTTSLEPTDELGDFRWIGVSANSPMIAKLQGLSGRQWVRLTDPAPVRGVAPAPGNQEHGGYDQAGVGTQDVVPDGATDPYLAGPTSGGAGAVAGAWAGGGASQAPRRRPPVAPVSQPSWYENPLVWIIGGVAVLAAAAVIFLTFLSRGPQVVQLFRGKPVNLTYGRDAAAIASCVLESNVARAPNGYSLKLPGTNTFSAGSTNIAVSVILSDTNNNQFATQGTNKLSVGSYTATVSVDTNASPDFRSTSPLVLTNAISVTPKPVRVVVESEGPFVYTNLVVGVRFKAYDAEYTNIPAGEILGDVLYTAKNYPSSPSLPPLPKSPEDFPFVYTATATLSKNYTAADGSITNKEVRVMASPVAAPATNAAKLPVPDLNPKSAKIVLLAGALKDVPATYWGGWPVDSEMSALDWRRGGTYAKVAQLGALQVAKVTSSNDESVFIFDLVNNVPSQKTSTKTPNYSDRSLIYRVTPKIGVGDVFIVELDSRDPYKNTEFIGPLLQAAGLRDLKVSASAKGIVFEPKEFFENVKCLPEGSALKVDFLGSAFADKSVGADGSVVLDIPSAPVVANKQSAPPAATPAPAPPPAAPNLAQKVLQIAFQDVTPVPDGAPDKGGDKRNKPRVDNKVWTAQECTTLKTLQTGNPGDCPEPEQGKSNDISAKDRVLRKALFQVMWTVERGGLYPQPKSFVQSDQDVLWKNGSRKLEDLQIDKIEPKYYKYLSASDVIRYLNTDLSNGQESKWVEVVSLWLDKRADYFNDETIKEGNAAGLSECKHLSSILKDRLKKFPQFVDKVFDAEAATAPTTDAEAGQSAAVEQAAAKVEEARKTDQFFAALRSGVIPTTVALKVLAADGTAYTIYTYTPPGGTR